MRVIVQKVQPKRANEDYAEFEAMRASLAAAIDEEPRPVAANDAAGEEDAGEYDAYADFIRYVTKMQAMQASAG